MQQTDSFVAFSHLRFLAKQQTGGSIMVEGLEMTCFQIISNVGAARSSYIEGIQKAKAGDFEGASR